MRERHVAKHDIASRAAGMSRERQWRDGRALARVAEDLLNPAYRDGRFSEFRQNPAHHANRPDEHAYDRQKKEEASDAEAAVRQPSSAPDGDDSHLDRKSTRLNSSHRTISYAVFCLKKKIIRNLIR